MARPTTKIRLNDLTPHAVGVALARRLLAYGGGLSRALAPLRLVPCEAGRELEGEALERALGGSRAAGLADVVCRYAQTGAGLTASESEAHCRELAELLDTAGVEDRSPEIDMVIHAAEARADLESGAKSVAKLQLAHLAGVDLKHVELLLRQGELAYAPSDEGEPHAVEAASARAWLTGKGLPLAEPKKRRKSSVRLFLDVGITAIRMRGVSKALAGGERP